MRVPFCCLVLICLARPAVTSDIDYARDVQPILQKHCIGCHTADEAQGGLVMESHQSLMKGGDSGVAVTPGASGSSRLLLMIRGELEPLMPPEGEPQLSEKQVETLTEWIEQGAPGPEGQLPLKRELRTPKIAASEGVAAPITALAMSPDGALRAVGRFGQIDLIDKDDTVVATLSESLLKVNSLAFSSDGSRLLVASGSTGAYGSALVFSIPNGELLTEFVGHRDVLYSAIYSPDESLVATAGYDREIILWDAVSGEAVRSLKGHNGAIYDLAFSPDGTILVSGCADETVKVWSVATGQRLDTMSQPEGEVFAVDVTPDGRFVVAGSADNRLRVWVLRSKSRPRINPVRATRFVDESPLVNFAFTQAGDAMVVLSESGNVKLIRCSDWNQVAQLDPLEEVGSDLCLTSDGKSVLVSLMDGRVVRRELPEVAAEAKQDFESKRPIYLDLGELEKLDEAKLRQEAESVRTLAADAGLDVPLQVARGSEISGVISQVGESDLYEWTAREGEVWAIDADSVQDSPIDPLVAVLDQEQQPVLRARLQAILDSYFTFRGKDSIQISDFRVFNWREMHLNEYLYAAGEVTRLSMYPRGPDSGYNVYPNEGKRWTYFGTSHTTHALGDPAYIVRPLRPGQSPTANGLPVFDIYYENDDDPTRVAGTGSRVLFTAPADGRYTVRISDTRGDGGESFRYRLRIRDARPGFRPSVTIAKPTLMRGAGREFVVRVDRLDGFNGPVTFDIPDLPPGIVANVPLTIQRGQRFAVGTFWIHENVEAWEGTLAPQVIAHAKIGGKVVERRVGPVGELSLGDRPSAIPSIQPLDRTVPEDEDWTLTVRRGETVSARVILRRKEGFTNEVSFGKENSGRNTAHGVYVDNIGLSGLLVRANEDEREFFLTADAITEPGRRSFFLTGAVDGGVTTHPITVEVLP